MIGGFLLWWERMDSNYRTQRIPDKIVFSCVSNNRITIGDFNNLVHSRYDKYDGGLNEFVETRLAKEDDIDQQKRELALGNDLADGVHIVIIAGICAGEIICTSHILHGVDDDELCLGMPVQKNRDLFRQALAQLRGLGDKVDVCRDRAAAR